MRNFRQLKVWAKAHELTLAVYAATKRFPREERYALTSQIRRAASSVAANIVEGEGRRSDGDLHRFVQIARGSAAELEYHLLLARDLHYLPVEEHQKLEATLDEVQRMLTGFAQAIKPDFLPDQRRPKASARVATRD